MIGKLKLFTLTLLCLALSVKSFPDGAPVDACVKDRANQPNHGQHRTQPLSTLPYRIFASSSYYGPNSMITGKLKSYNKFLFTFMSELKRSD